MTAKHELSRLEQERQIMRVAFALMAKRGLDKVTMTEIAAAAGVSRGTVFNRFGSKRAIVEAITSSVFVSYQAMLQKALDDPRTPTPVLARALFEQMGANIERWRDFFGSFFREIASLQARSNEGGPGQRARKTALELLTKLLDRGQARGDLAAGHRPDDLAVAFDNLVNGTVMHWLYEDASESLRDRMRRAAEIFLGGIEIDATGGRFPLPDLAPDGFDESDPVRVFSWRDS